MRLAVRFQARPPGQGGFEGAALAFEGLPLCPEGFPLFPERFALLFEARHGFGVTGIFALLALVPGVAHLANAPQDGGDGPGADDEGCVSYPVMACLLFPAARPPYQSQSQ